MCSSILFADFYLVASLVGRTPGDPLLADFSGGLQEARECSEEGVLKLKEGTFFMGIPEEGNKLYIRPCYDSLKRALEEHFRAGGSAAAVIGNPGERFGIHFYKGL